VGWSGRGALAGRGSSEPEVCGGAFYGSVEWDGGDFEKTATMVDRIKARMPKLDAAGMLRFRANELGDS